MSDPRSGCEPISSHLHSTTPSSAMAVPAKGLISIAIITPLSIHLIPVLVATANRV